MKLQTVSAMLFLLIVTPQIVIAQSAKEEGKRLGNDLKTMVEQAVKAPVTANTVPGFQSDRPAEQDYYDKPSSMGVDAATVSDPAPQAVRDSMALRPRVEPEAIGAFLGLGFEAQDNPDAYVSGFSGEYGECVELPVGDGPDTYYIRTCNEGLTVEYTSGVCLITLTHHFDQVFGYRCRDSISIGSRLICGQTDFSGCRIVDVRYECRQNPRRPFQTICDPDRAIFFEFTYECNVARPLLTPDYHRITYLNSSRNETACADLENGATCTQLSEVCTEGPETRLINGVAIMKDCWAWRRDYDCVSFRPATDCTVAEDDPACTFDHQECLSAAEDGSCTMYEKIYHCTVPGGPTGEIAVTCGEDIYCLDGSCDSITREANTSFPKAAAALQMMEQQPGEFDKTDYTIFDGDNLTCPKTLFGVVNCCTDDGFLVDIGLVGCDGEAKALAEKKAAGLCHYVGTYCSSKILGICVKKRKSYCCFKGKLSRIIMEQGRAQLGISWGEADSPNCEGFTVTQFQSLDFSRMDLSEFYADAQATTVLRAEEGVVNDLKSRIEAYYGQ